MHTGPDSSRYDVSDSRTGFQSVFSREVSATFAHRNSSSDFPDGLLVQNSRSPIGRLLSPGGPPAIARLVATIVVDSVNRCSIGPISHVRKERFERVPPVVTNRNSASSVTMESDRLRVSAPLDDCLPGRVDAALGHSMGACSIIGIAAATCTHGPSAMNSLGSALASIEPEGLPAFRSGDPGDASPESVSLSNPVDHWHSAALSHVALGNHSTPKSQWDIRRGLN